MRNALLAAISHDHRTPLADIVGAASSLRNRTPAGARTARRLDRIMQEATRLRRLTDNTCSWRAWTVPGWRWRADWQSAEDLVGAALNRDRARATRSAACARAVEPGLPLLWCDATLLSRGWTT